jgi:hypothetical protein
VEIHLTNKQFKILVEKSGTQVMDEDRKGWPHGVGESGNSRYLFSTI